MSRNLSFACAAAVCKNGGWKTYGVFKNQGDCVSFVSKRHGSDVLHLTRPPLTPPS